GRGFCAGGDVNDFKGSPDALHDMIANLTHRWFKAFWALPQPVVAAVNGPAVGAGCNLALACDLIYAAEGSYFAQPFLQIGLIPDVGGAFSLPRLVGLARAKELVLLGRRLDAATARDWGLV